MGKYSVPEEIRKFKPKGRMVKAQGSHYYVYNYKTMTIDGKRKTIMGDCIGKIEPTIGFVPNSNYHDNDDQTIYEYGQYYLAMSLTKSVLEELAMAFPNREDVVRIYLIALIHFVNGFSAIRDIPEYFKQSYMSLALPSMAFGEQKISDVYTALGNRTTRVDKYIENVMKNTSAMAVDGHCMPNYSKENDLAEYGNKYQKFNSTQVNLLMAYDIETSQPIYSDIFLGSELDKTTIKDLFGRFSFKNKLFIVDNGFYSEENLKEMSKDGNSFIIPLSRNHDLYKAAVESMRLTRKFIYKNGKKTTIIECGQFKVYGDIKVPEGRNVYIFRDLEQNLKETEEYENAILQGIAGFTKEELRKTKKYFGMIVLYTNHDAAPEEIFGLYKKRWKIETFYDVLSNHLEIDALCLDDYYRMKGFSFITLLIGRMNSAFTSTLKKLPGVSVKEILLKARAMKIQKRGDYYEVCNIKKTTRERFKTMGVEINKIIKSPYINFAAILDALPKN